MARIPPLLALGYLLLVKSTYQRAHVSAIVSESSSKDSWGGEQKRIQVQREVSP